MHLYHMESGGRLWSLLVTAWLSSKGIAAYTPEARWGQAALITNDAVFIHGGKSDPFNSFSYTSAPTTNDLLYLSLSLPFDTANPPWELLVGSAVTDSQAPPALSWHTLAAYNTSNVLLFGGLPGFNTPIVLFDRADSASLLDVTNILQPVWLPLPLAWAGQPPRRIHHSAASFPSRTVYIIGGEKADGSGEVSSDHYMYDPQAQQFSQLPSENGPYDIYGHVSIMLSDARLLIFGGISQGSLNQLSTIWVLDTTKDPPSWSMLPVDTTSLPSPRRAFAAARVGDDKILIHGGSDANLQVNFDDGWILDVSREPAVWQYVEPLNQLGARRDHFAISCNGQVIIGYGYLDSQPAPAAMRIFDPSTNSFLSSFTPAPPTATIAHTSAGQSKTSTGTAPTKDPGSSTDTNSSGSNRPTVTGGTPGDDNDKGPSTSTIAVSTTLGVLGAVVVGAVVFIYVRRRQQKKRGQGSFLLMEDDRDGGNSSLHSGYVIPAATMHDEKESSGHNKWGGRLLGTAFGVASTISAVAKSRDARNTYRRRDMLADEDTRDFGEWYHSRRRDGTSGSSWSLKSIIGGHFRSHEPSTFSQGTGASHRFERTDPHSEGASLVYSDDLGTPGIEGNSRPLNRRELSNFSTRSGLSYSDPFADPHQEAAWDSGRYRDEEDDHQYEPTSATTSRLQHPLPTIRTALPISMGGHPLSPLSEHTSKTSLPPNDYSTSASSHAHSSENPFDTSNSHITSHTSIEPTSRLTSNPSTDPPRSPKLLSPSAAINATSQAPSMQRSHSWWSRFYHTSFLDRKPISVSRRSALFDIRDPKPPPVLGPIQESSQLTSPGDSPSKSSDRESVTGGKLSRGHSRVYTADHGKSLTSLRTVDTEQIERMAGTMDVVQRVRTRSHRTSGSISGLSVDSQQAGYDASNFVPEELVTVSSPVEMRLSEAWDSTPFGLPLSVPPIARPNSTSERSKTPVPDPLSPTVIQPLPQVPLSPIALYNRSIPSGVSTVFVAQPGGGPATPTARSSVAARVQMYERKLSQDQEQPPPTNTRQREERSAQKGKVSINYGLVPRPSLFVANPDHRNSSGDS